MADIGAIKSFFGTCPPEVRQAAEQAFTYVLNNLTLGAPDQNRAKNFQWYWLTSTTPAVANTEFSIAHGLGRVPNVMLSALPLNAIGGQTVPLQVSRAADANRVYLKSSSTSAAITLLVE